MSKGPPKIKEPTKTQAARIRRQAQSDPDAPLQTDEQLSMFKRSRGRPRGSNKVRVQGYFDQDIVAHFKKDGAGYTTRMNNALREAIKRGLV